MKVKFKIKGLDCANCAAELERKIQKIEGITEASISFMTEKMIIECNDNEKDEIVEKIKKVVKKEEPDVVVEER
ncbi:MAG: heavy-metal-associated domain-containing protein [Clostridia bacterium]|jgi:cation transport ATPase|nr:heavy-metal-associated domain-containing protein [Clostridia bacterium]